MVEAADVAEAELGGEVAPNRRGLGHAPAEPGPAVEVVNEGLLVGEMREVAKEGDVSGGLCHALDLGGRGGHAHQRLGGDTGDVGLLVHGDLVGVKAVGIFLHLETFDHSAETALAGLGLGDNEVADTGLAGTGGTAETMDVGLLGAGGGDLDNVGDVGEIHSASNNVGRQHNSGLGALEVVGGAGTGRLCETRVDLDDGGGEKRVAFVGLGAGVAERGGGEGSELGGGEEDDSLERLAGLLSLKETSVADLVYSGKQVLETLASDHVLRDTFVDSGLTSLDHLQELVVRSESLGDHLEDLLGHGR